MLVDCGIDELGHRVNVAAVGGHRFSDLLQVVQAMLLVQAHTFQQPVQNPRGLIGEDLLRDAAFLGPQRGDFGRELDRLHPFPDGVVIGVEAWQIVGGHPHHELDTPLPVLLIQATRLRGVTTGKAFHQRLVEPFVLVQLGQRDEALAA